MEVRQIDGLFQGDLATTTGGVARLGLGLHLCKELVEKQDGRIWVESAPGQGRNASFSLPLSS